MFAHFFTCALINLHFELKKKNSFKYQNYTFVCNFCLIIIVIFKYLDLGQLSNFDNLLGKSRRSRGCGEDRLLFGENNCEWTNVENVRRNFLKIIYDASGAQGFLQRVCYAIHIRSTSKSSNVALRTAVNDAINLITCVPAHLRPFHA